MMLHDAAHDSGSAPTGVATTAQTKPPELSKLVDEVAEKVDELKQAWDEYAPKRPEDAAKRTPAP